MKNSTAFSIKLLVYLVLLVLLFPTNGNSQNSNNFNREFWQNVQFGGGIGLNFGNGFFSGMLAPSAIYRFSPYVATGIGLNAQYSSQRDAFNSTVIGGSLIGLLNPVNEIQISAELEQLYVNRDFDENFVNNIDSEYWYPALFLGLGYTNGNMTFGIRFDLLFDEDKSIQNQAWMPFVRFWF